MLSARKVLLIFTALIVGLLGFFIGAKVASVQQPGFENEQERGARRGAARRDRHTTGKEGEVESGALGSSEEAQANREETKAVEKAMGTLPRSLSERVFITADGRTPLDAAWVQINFKKPDESFAYVLSFSAEPTGGRGSATEHVWPNFTVDSNCVRIPALPDERAPRAAAWRFGTKYHLRYAVLKSSPFRKAIKDSELGWYENIIEIPAYIAPRRVHRIEVVAEHPVGTLNPKKTIKGRITVPLPSGAEKYSVEYYASKPDVFRRTYVRKGGRFEITTDELGGNLHVQKNQRTGQAWMYVRKVDSYDLVLPRDADLVLRKENLVEFDVKIPLRHVKPDLDGVCLKVQRDDAGPISWVDLDEVSQRALKKVREKGLVGMKAMPGSYYLQLVYWREGAGWDERRFQFIGKLTIKKSDAGKTLEVEPLEE